MVAGTLPSRGGRYPRVYLHIYQEVRHSLRAERVPTMLFRLLRLLKLTLANKRVRVLIGTVAASICVVAAACQAALAATGAGAPAVAAEAYAVP